MSDKQNILNGIIQQGILPLFYCADAQVSLDVVRTLYRAGIRIIEYTNRGEKALENFRTLKKLQREELPGLYLGIGTIKSLQDAKDYIDADADFLVSPLINPEVGKLAAEKDMLWIPGCMTPTELFTAQQYGARLVKLFPANVLEADFLIAVKELFQDLLFIPTGGVELNQDNISGWFKAGVSAVGIGSKLITKNVLEHRDYDNLYISTLTAIELVKNAR